MCNSLLQDQVFSEQDAFFAWTFVKRRPFWQTLLSFCWPVLTLAICLFPVYPHQCKLLILYSCAGVLLLILSLLLCRSYSPFHCLIFVLFFYISISHSYALVLFHFFLNEAIVSTQINHSYSFVNNLILGVLHLKHYGRMLSKFF